MKYIAQTTVTHTPTGAVIQSGEAVDVSHLTPDEVLMLVELNVIQPAPTPGKKSQLEAPADDGQEA